MEQMVKTMKKEGAAASSAAHSDTETDSNFSKPDPGLLQSVKRELSFTNNELVKEEILEDGSQDDSEQQYVHVVSTSAGTGGVNEACSTSLGDLFDVKYEWTEIDIGPTVLQPMDIYYTINKHNMNAAMEEKTTAENTNDDCNEAMPGSGGRNRSVENKRRDSKTTASRKFHQTTTEMDCDKAHINSPMTPHVRLKKEDLHKLLHQLRTTSSNSSKCNRTSHKPHLQSARDKLHRRNRRRAVTTRGPVAGPSNQSGDIRVKTKQNSFACDFCGNECSSKVGLNLDKCSHCSVKLKNRLVNNESHTKKTHYTRDKQFAQRGDLTKQARFHTAANLFQCDAKFAVKRSLTRHMRVHTGEKPFQCETCGAKFAHKYHLVQHMKVHTGEKPYHCKTCGARFTRSSLLTRHMRIHTGEKPFQCETCGAKFAHQGNLISHMRVHTGEKPYHCKTCSVRFAQRGYLTEHMRIHTGEKPFHCETCDAKFAQQGSLTNHLRVHTGEKPFQCETCDAKFAHKGSLVSHMRIHTGEKPFHCVTCGAKFARKCHLIQHMGVHTGEKPFRCETCDANFARKSHLIQHLRVHTGEKSYQCQICDAKFAQRIMLTSHRRVHIGD